MRKYKLDLPWKKSNRRGTAISHIVALAALTMAGGVFKPSEAIAQTSISPTTQAKRSVGGKCESTGQEITDRAKAYNDAYISEDVDKLYYDFWTPTHYEFLPTFARDREGMRERMTQFYSSGGKIYGSMPFPVEIDLGYHVG